MEPWRRKHHHTASNTGDATSKQQQASSWPASDARLMCRRLWDSAPQEEQSVQGPYWCRPSTACLLDVYLQELQHHQYSSLLDLGVCWCLPPRCLSLCCCCCCLPGVTTDILHSRCKWVLGIDLNWDPVARYMAHSAGLVRMHT